MVSRSARHNEVWPSNKDRPEALRYSSAVILFYPINDVRYLCFQFFARQSARVCNTCFLEYTTEHLDQFKLLNGTIVFGTDRLERLLRVHLVTPERASSRAEAAVS
jgi:hypothetical protein